MSGKKVSDPNCREPALRVLRTIGVRHLFSARSLVRRRSACSAVVEVRGAVPAARTSAGRTVPVRHRPASGFPRCQSSDEDAASHSTGSCESRLAIDAAQSRVCATGLASDLGWSLQNTGKVSGTLSAARQCHPAEVETDGGGQVFQCGLPGLSDRCAAQLA